MGSCRLSLNYAWCVGKYESEEETLPLFSGYSLRSRYEDNWEPRRGYSPIKVKGVLVLPLRVFPTQTKELILVPFLNKRKSF